MHFHYMTNMATPSHRNLCPMVYEIYNFGRGSHVHLSDSGDLKKIWDIQGFEKSKFEIHTNIV